MRVAELHDAYVGLRRVRVELLEPRERQSKPRRMLEMADRVGTDLQLFAG